MQRPPYQTQEIEMTLLNDKTVEEALSDDGVEHVERRVEEPDTEEVILAEAIIPNAHASTCENLPQSVYLRAKALHVGTADVQAKRGLREIDESGRRNTHDDTLEIEIDEAGTRK